MIKFLTGDTREMCRTIPDNSISLVAASPPFLGLRNYGHDKTFEIGSELDPATFIDTLLDCTAEWGRVLAPWGSLAIELGDTYSGSGGAGGDYNEGGLRDGQNAFVGSARSARQRSDGGQYGNLRPGGTKCNVETRPATTGGPGWPLAKSLALIPELYAVALAYGINPLTGKPSPAGRWRVRNVVVWHRPNPAVGALGDKVRPSTSYITIATRSDKRWFDLDSVRHSNDRVSDDPGGYRMVGGSPTHDAGPRCQNTSGAPPLDCWFDEYDGTHDTWTMTTQPSSLAHYAMWPAKLAERLILMMCPREVCTVCGTPRRRITVTTNAVGKAVRSRSEGRSGRTDCPVSSAGPNVSERETIGWSDCGHDSFTPGVTLDPFAGSGTSLAVADFHGRDAIGIDLYPENRDLYPARRLEVQRALNPTHVPQINGQIDLFGAAS